MTESGEIEEAEQFPNIIAVNSSDQTNFNAIPRGRFNIGARVTFVSQKEVADNLL